MSKPRSWVADLAAFAVIRIVVCVLQGLPPRGSQAFAHFLAWLAYRVDRRHRLVADENLERAFPGLDPASRDRVVRKVYLHFCRLLVDMVMIPRKFHPNNWRRYAELPQGEDPGVPRLAKPYAQEELARVLASIMSRDSGSKVVSLVAARREVSGRVC